MANKWFYRRNGVEHGPFTIDQLRHLLSSGQMALAESVRNVNTNEWVPVGQVRELGLSIDAAIPLETYRTQPSYDNLKPPSISRLDPKRAPHAAPNNVKPSADTSSKLPWVVVGAAVLFLLGLCVYAISDGAQRAEIQKVETANADVEDAIKKARAWIADGDVADAEKIESDLSRAQANTLATNANLVSPVLADFRTAKPLKEAANLYALARKAIQQRQFDKAITFLQQYIAHPAAADGHRAQSLLSEVQTVTSDSEAIKALLSMDEPTFASFSSLGELKSPQSPDFSHPILKETYIAVLTKNVAEAKRQRDKNQELARQAEAKRISELAQKRLEEESRRRKAEADRIAEEERQEQIAMQKRIAEMERLHKERMAKDARVRRLSAAGLLDIADDPKEYVGLTFTFTVWIDGSSVRPVQKTDIFSGERRIDGYVLQITPGDRDPHKADHVGNMFGIIPHKLAPFITSKSLARTLQDKLEPLRHTKADITFTVEEVVLDKFLGQKTVAYLAEVSSVSLYSYTK